MITQEENISNSSIIDQPPEPPQIEGEVDIPFGNTPSSNYSHSSGNLGKTDSLDDQITKFKYLTGKTVLFISMIAMGIAVAASIILSFFKMENQLVGNAFEVFKLIAMTVLGYIFGSKSK